MLSNFDLEKICKFYKLPIVSISMKDELPSTIKDGCYIVNMQSSSQGNGTHWVALFVYKFNAFYFDSFGGLPPNEIMKFVKKRNNCHLFYNNWIIQNIKSSQCGWYCIAFLKHMYQNLLQDLKVRPPRHMTHSIILYYGHMPWTFHLCFINRFTFDGY